MEQNGRIQLCISIQLCDYTKSLAQCRQIAQAVQDQIIRLLYKQQLIIIDKQTKKVKGLSFNWRKTDAIKARLSICFVFWHPNNVKAIANFSEDLRNLMKDIARIAKLEVRTKGLLDEQFVDLESNTNRLEQRITQYNNIHKIYQKEE